MGRISFLEGVLGKVGLGLWKDFHFRVGDVLESIPEEGCSGELGQKFLKTQLGSLACWCITDSLSHITYVETNNSELG